MTKKDYIIVASSIWRSGFIEDKNKVRQEAKEKMRRLIAIDLATEMAQDNPRFDRKKFLQACNVTDSI